MLNITVIDAISQGITISPNENTTLLIIPPNPITFTSSGPGEIVTWELEGELTTGLRSHQQIRPFGELQLN